MTQIVALAVIAALAVPLTLLVRHWQEQQRERTRAVAARHGLEVDLTRKGPPPIGFDLFDLGRRRRVTTQMWRRGGQDSVFQYEYTVGSGKSSTTHRRTVALIDLPLDAPHLTISTESAWSRIKRAVGLRDIEVESPAFNDHYQVRSDDDRFAITLLDPPMIDWFLSPGSGQGAVSFELLGPWLLCHCEQLEVEELPRLLGWSGSVRDRLPVVLSDLYRRQTT